MAGVIGADKVKTVPLSSDTVWDRKDRMAADCPNQYYKKLREGAYAVQLAEMTTAADMLGTHC